MKNEYSKNESLHNLRYSTYLKHRTLIKINTRYSTLWQWVLSERQSLRKLTLIIVKVLRRLKLN